MFLSINVPNKPTSIPDKTTCFSYITIGVANNDKDVVNNNVDNTNTNTNIRN